MGFNNGTKDTFILCFRVFDCNGDFVWYDFCLNIKSVIDEF